MPLRFSAAALLLLASQQQNVEAFSVPSRLTPTVKSSSLHTRLYSATLPDIKNINGDGTAKSTSWDCDEEAVCVEVPACDEQVCRTSLDVRIHNKWYDLSGWRKAHPSGSHWIDWYDGRDATEVMDAFHTDKGREMYKRLPASKPEAVAMLSKTAKPDTSTQIAFRKLRAELEADGWWERDMKHEATQIGIWASLVVTAGALANTVYAPVSCFLLALSMTAAGWLGHDYIHGVDKFAMKIRNFAAFAAGLAPIWWSDKHNKHHALTNEMGVDEDIATDPFLYTWAPDPSKDSPLRKIQHWIFFIPFSFMFALWRIDSVKVTIEAVEKKRPAAKSELYALLGHYAVLFTVFPVSVWLPAVFLSGLMSALIVTPTHQSEELFEDYQPDWVTAQFQSTRNAVTTNPFSEWIWGGMQYQLEHHLFPSMPRNRYPALRSIMQKFAKDNNVPGGYRETGEFKILKMNWDTYRDVAGQPAVPGAISSHGRPGQLAAICETESPAVREAASTSI